MTKSFEALPSRAQTLKFRITARDGRGGFAFDDLSVVVAPSGPFRITHPNTAASLRGGSAQTVTWSVAGTEQSPVSCSQVKISISLDGGQTYQVLVSHTANDGAESITLPNTPSTRARVRVEAIVPATANSTFFDVSDVDFTITM